MDSDVNLDEDCFGLEFVPPPNSDEFDSESDSEMNQTIIESKPVEVTIPKLPEEVKLEELKPLTARQIKRRQQKLNKNSNTSMSLDSSSEVLVLATTSVASPMQIGETTEIKIPGSSRGALIKSSILSKSTIQSAGNAISLELNKGKPKALTMYQKSSSGGVQSKLHKGGLEKPEPIQPRPKPKTNASRFELNKGKSETLVPYQKSNFGGIRSKLNKGGLETPKDTQKNPSVTIHTKGTFSQNTSGTRKRLRGSDATPPELKHPKNKRKNRLPP